MWLSVWTHSFSAEMHSLNIVSVKINRKQNISVYIKKK